jgi:hypothetical protein
VQVTTPAASVQVGAPGLELTNVNPAGKVSVTTMFEASAFPLLVTVTVQVMFWPCVTVAGPLLLKLSTAAHPVTSPLTALPLGGIVMGAAAPKVPVAVFV